MKFLFACGGTGGHICPALSMAGLVRERHPGAEILFVGAAGGMETKLVPREGYPIETVNIKGLRHKLSPSALLHNLKVAAGMAGSLSQAKRILERFRPDVVVGTGGYACFPIVWQAARMRIPTACHESNAAPGVTTRILAGRVDKVMVSMADAARAYRVPVEITGMPVRGAFAEVDKADARRALGLDERPFVVSAFGSLGARDMNTRMAEFIRLAVRDGGIQLLHAAGRAGMEWLPSLIRDKGIDLEAHPHIRVVEYIYDMPQVMNAADLVLCRAGASTLSELTLTRTPAILFPSPNVTGNHQEKNARVLEAAGAAALRFERNTDGAVLYKLAGDMLSDRPRLDDMSRRLGELATPDAAERIYRLLMSLRGKNGA